MMGNHNTDVDVESLQKSGRRRGTCLDVFLVVSTIVLFVTVGALGAGGAIVVYRLQSKPSSLPSYELHSKQLSQLRGDTPSPAFKMQNFAYLEASLSRLENSTMRWNTVMYGEGSSIGSNFLFEESQNYLMPKKEGIYFIYIELNLSCTGVCNAGILTVQLDDILTCKVELSTEANHASRKCWTVSPLKEKKLFAQMTVPTEGLDNWSLDLLGSKMGIFLVN